MGGFGGDRWKVGLGLGVGIALLPVPVQGQITPAQDGISTQVQTVGAESIITGGQVSQGGENVFHSFEQFGVETGQTAHFLTPAATQRVLGRIVGGGPSLIDGQVRLSGSNANLFLLNPAGVVFGENASLDVPGSFGVSTATGFGFAGDRWFGLGTGSDVAGLGGALTGLRFEVGGGAAGAIANFGSLSVVPGAQLWLVGGAVLNRGSLTASGGTVVLAAVKGSQGVRFGMPGSLLQFELEALGVEAGVGESLGSGGAIAPINPLTLPELLTGGEIAEAADGVTVARDGTVVLAGRGLTPDTGVAIAPGLTLLNGSIDVSSSQGVGGQAVVTGSNIVAVDGTVDATGALGGGWVAMGGNWQGGPGLPTAQNLWVDRASSVDASAVERGNGGVVVFWSEGSTQFFGEVVARGGAIAGDGGLVEISGRSQLGFDGRVDLSAPAGQLGSLLLDPDRIVIVASQPATASDTTAAPTTDTTMGNEPARDNAGQMDSNTRPQDQNGNDAGNEQPRDTSGDSVSGAMDSMDSMDGSGDSMAGDSIGGAIADPGDSLTGAMDSLGGANSGPETGDSVNGAAGNSNAPNTNTGDSLTGAMDGAEASGDSVSGSMDTGGNVGNPMDEDSMGGAMAPSQNAGDSMAGAIADMTEGAEFEDSVAGAIADMTDSLNGAMDSMMDEPTNNAPTNNAPMNLSLGNGRVARNGDVLTEETINGDGFVQPNGVTINGTDLPGSTLTISAAALENVQGAIALEATGEIVIEDGVSLNFVDTVSMPGQPATPITFSVTNGPFTADPTQTINTNGRALTIQSQGITVGDITTTGANGVAANIDLSSQQGNVRAGFLDVSGGLAAGRVTVQGPRGVVLTAIDARGGPEGTGGAIEVISGGPLQFVGGFVDELGRLTSASTTGGILSGNILIGHIGFTSNPVVPFTVGDGGTNGTAGVLQAGGTELQGQSIAMVSSFNAAQTAMEPNSGSIQITDTGAAQTQLEILTTNGSGAEITSALSQGEGEGGVDGLDGQSQGQGEFGGQGAGGDVLDFDGDGEGDGESRHHNNGGGDRPEGPGGSGEQFGTAVTSTVTQASLGRGTDVQGFRQSLSDRVNQLTGQQLVGNLEHLRAAEYGNHWGVSYQVPLVDSSFADIQEVLRAIAKDPGKISAVLYTFAHRDKLELTLVLPTGQPLRRTVPNVSLQDLRATTIQFRRQLTNRTFGNLPTYLPPAKKLYQWLIAPFREALDENQVEVLQFSLDPGLRSLPLAALHDGEQFLIENFAVATIPSFALLDTTYRSLDNSTVLVAGTSQFETLPTLPAVPVEVATIEATWNTVDLIDNQFTLEDIRTARRDSNFAIAHLATHAFFKPGDPKNSFVQLWGNERVPLDAIASLNFHTPPLELLVLSACRTALGDDQAELGFAGLSVQSGAKSVVASLWQVSDSGTLALMAKLYDALADLPTKAEALRQAQLAMLRGEVTINGGKLQGTSRGEFALPNTITEGTLDFTHPYFWGSFTLVGSPW